MKDSKQDRIRATVFRSVLGCKRQEFGIGWPDRLWLWAQCAEPKKDHLSQWTFGGKQRFLVSEPYGRDDASSFGSIQPQHYVPTPWYAHKDYALDHPMNREWAKLLSRYQALAWVALPIGWGLWNPPRTKMFLVEVPGSTLDLAEIKKTLTDSATAQQSLFIEPSV
jgi:hypothetical protein